MNNNILNGNNLKKKINFTFMFIRINYCLIMILLILKSTIFLQILGNFLSNLKKVFY